MERLAATLVLRLSLIHIFTSMSCGRALFAYPGPRRKVDFLSLIHILLVPAMGSMFVTTDSSLATALVPVLNSSIVIKQVLAGVTDTRFLIVAMASSAAYAALALLISVRLFESERVLLKS